MDRNSMNLMLTANSLATRPALFRMARSERTRYARLVREANIKPDRVGGTP
jgi:hypothetical protein